MPKVASVGEALFLSISVNTIWMLHGCGEAALDAGLFTLMLNP
jgi:hypothetical protein